MCTEKEYIKLVEALCSEHNIQLIKVRDLVLITIYIFIFVYLVFTLSLYDNNTILLSQIKILVILPKL